MPELAIWDKAKPEVDWSLLEWKPRILEHGENYDDPWICPSRPKPDSEVVKPKDWRLGQGRRVWVESHNGPVEYKSVREAYRVLSRRTYLKRSMSTLATLCKSLGLRCGYVDEKS